MNDYKEMLNHCIEQSEKLLQRAENGEWDQLEEELSGRDRTLQNILEYEFTAEEAGFVRSAIDKITTSDQQLMILVKANRERVFQQLRKGNQGQKMKVAYGKTRRPY